MRPRSAVAKAKAVIAPLDDVHHSAWRRLVWIVINAEHSAIDVAADAERVPETGSDAAQLLAVGGAVEDVPALFVGDRGAVGTDQLEVNAEVLAHAEVKIALGIEAEPRQAIVRIVPLGVAK